MVIQRPSMVRSAAVLSSALSLAKAFSPSAASCPRPFQGSDRTSADVRWVEVGGVGREIAELGALGLDRLAHPLDLVRGQVVHERPGGLSSDLRRRQGQQALEG
jgi:hypothetical protein